MSYMFSGQHRRGMRFRRGERGTAAAAAQAKDTGKKLNECAAIHAGSSVSIRVNEISACQQAVRY